MRRTILIVEDTEACASTLEIALSRIRGIDILIACNGDQAWQLLNRANAQVRALVTDLNMAGMDGFQLIDRVRSQEPWARLPIVVITGCTDPRTPERVRKLGANAFFAKPYSPAQVREAVEQLLNDTKS